MQTYYDTGCLIFKKRDKYFVLDTTNNNIYFGENYSIEEIIKEREDIEGVRTEYASPNLNTLKSLILCVSSKCNLACKYCYVNGNYDDYTGSIMKKECFEKIIETFFSGKYEIKDIHFFGGEPLINWDYIKYFIESLKEKCIAQNIPIPSFSLTTNGTLIDENIAREIKKYKIEVAISIDGPKHMNDKYRIDRYGAGSFERVYNAINIMNNLKIDFGIESTMPIDYLCINNKWNDYFEFHKNIKSKYSAIFLESINNKELIKYENLNDSIINFANYYVDYFFKEILFCEKSPGFFYIVNSILKIISNNSNGVCGAGATQIFIKSNGDVYPCQLFYSNPTYNQGKFYDHNNNEKNIIFYFNNIYKKSHSCASCKLYKYCGAKCPGNNFNSTGNPSIVGSVSCKFEKAVFNRIIYNLFDYIEDDSKFEIFNELMQQQCNKCRL